jgi:hypothetical protein
MFILKIYVMKYKELATEMYQMVNSGQPMEAFEKFYHEDSSMIESTGEVRQGKDTSREFEQNYLSSVKEFHGQLIRETNTDLENGNST